MKKTLVSATLIALGATPLMAAGHASVTGFGLAGEGKTLVTFADMSDPATHTTTDLTGGTLDAIAYRPVTGELIGFSKSGMIYVVDPATGALTDTGASFADDATMGADAAVAFDFNNKIDAVRAVSSDGVNLVYFPGDFGGDKANTIKRFTDLAYAEGDANAGATPMVFANGYTNAVNGAKQDSTFQYALDSGTDALLSLANNAGTLATIAPLTLDGKAVDVSAMGGMEIVSGGADDNSAMALLSMEGQESAGLYAIDLDTGALSLMGDTGMGGFTGFAAMMGN